MNLNLLLFVAVSASLLSSSAAEPSSSARQWKYDVFLSFRGLDTRQSVAFELYDRLQRRGIKTFMDDPDLLGHPISPTLDATIEESRFAIVLLSTNYASSTWCLEELRKICECMKDGNIILPIFYRVEPSDVRHRRNFEQAFTWHENSGQHTSEKVQQWRDALEKMASISGWHTQNFRNDRELVDAIVDFVCDLPLWAQMSQLSYFGFFFMRLHLHLCFLSFRSLLRILSLSIHRKNPAVFRHVVAFSHGLLLSASRSLLQRNFTKRSFESEERLEEVPGHEDLRHGRNDQHLSNVTNQIAQTELHGGH